FLANQYAFPAKPRNMWELGVGLGMYNVSGDVPTQFFWHKGNGGYGFHAHIRKSWGYVFSTRLQYMYGVAKGLSWQEDRNYRWDPAWMDNGYQANPSINGSPAGYRIDPIFHNYRMEAHQLNF